MKQQVIRTMKIMCSETDIKNIFCFIHDQIWRSLGCSDLGPNLVSSRIQKSLTVILNIHPSSDAYGERIVSVFCTQFLSIEVLPKMQRISQTVGSSSNDILIAWSVIA